MLNIFHIFQNAIRFTMSVIRNTSESTIRHWLEVSISSESWIMLMSFFGSVPVTDQSELYTIRNLHVIGQAGNRSLLQAAINEFLLDEDEIGGEGEHDDRRGRASGCGEGAAAADRREKGLAFCRWCTALGCAPIPAEGYDGIRVIAYGSVQTDAAVMAEVKMNGPVACSINAFCILPGMENRTTGIFDYRCEVSSTKTACNSSSLIISASVTLLFGQCDR